MSLSNRLDAVVQRIGQSIKEINSELGTDRKYRVFRPPLTDIGPGVDSVNLGRYWFDGVEMHYELSIRMSANGAGFVGNNPSFKMVTDMELNDPFPSRVIGYGHAHDATTGLLYSATPIRTSATQVRFFYSQGTTQSQLSPFTTSAPVTWGILDGIYVSGSYIPQVKSAPNNFLAYGDSITRFENAAGQPPDINWAPQVPTEGLVFGGGFARDSATSAIVLANAVPLSADVGVGMVGVNDIAQSVPQATTLANVVSLRNKVGTDKWLLCKIAPYDANPAAAQALNVAYENLAASNGWGISDPWGAYRAANGSWVAGASYDGTHPNPPATAAAALVIRADIQALLAS